MSEVLAGKIGVTNGGEWNAETYYEEATFVRHQNNLYLSNLPSTGIEPTNEEYWMLAMEGFSGEDVQTLIDSINNIINGTTQVGNALTLDGHGAEYFATAEDTKAVKIKGSVNTLFTPTEEGTWFVTNSADGTFPYVYGLLEVRYGSYNEEFTATFKSTGIDNRLYYTTFTNGHWGVWKNFATIAELANYIAKADKPTGTYTGNGSAEQRIIATGGIGNVAVVTSIHGTAFVAHSGGIMMNASAVVPFGSETSSMFQGNMAINTDDARLNASGVTYTYQVL